MKSTAAYKINTSLDVDMKFIAFCFVNYLDVMFGNIAQLLLTSDKNIFDTSNLKQSDFFR